MEELIKSIGKLIEEKGIVDTAFVTIIDKNNQTANLQFGDSFKAIGFPEASKYALLKNLEE